MISNYTIKLQMMHTLYLAAKNMGQHKQTIPSPLPWQP